jgi:hypothetical protein
MLRLVVVFATLACAVLPHGARAATMAVTSGLYARHNAASYTGTAPWGDASGNGNSASIAGSISAGAVAGFASSASVPYVTGATITSSVTFTALPATWSLCTLSRYGGTALNQRIFSSQKENFIHGHWIGAPGIVYYSELYTWMGVNGSSGATGAGLHPARYSTANWVATCSALSASACSLLVDGLLTPCSQLGAPPSTSMGAVTINTGVTNEPTTGWQVRAAAECLACRPACFIVFALTPPAPCAMPGAQVADFLLYSRTLSIGEMANITRYMQAQYSLSWLGVCTLGAAHRVLPSVTPGVTAYASSPAADSGAAASRWTLTAGAGVSYDPTGGALSFDGTSAATVSFGGITLSGGSITLVVWARFNAFQASGWERVFEFAGGSGGWLANLALQAYNGQLGVYCGANSGLTMPLVGTGSTTYPAGQWMQLAVVASAASNTVTFYINTLFVARGTSAAVMPIVLSGAKPAAYFGLGVQSYPTGAFLNGTIADFQWYDAALSSADITALYSNTPAAGFADVCALPPPLASLTNVAQGKTASASAMYSLGGYTGTPSLATDGVTACDSPQESGVVIVNTAAAGVGWLMIDLGAAYFVHEARPAPSVPPAARALHSYHSGG